MLGRATVATATAFVLAPLVAATAAALVAIATNAPIVARVVLGGGTGGIEDALDDLVEARDLALISVVEDRAGFDPLRAQLVDDLDRIAAGEAQIAERVRAHRLLELRGDVGRRASAVTGRRLLGQQLLGLGDQLLATGARSAAGSSSVPLTASGCAVTT